MTSLRYGAATDVGVVRTNNEDQLLTAETLFAVADGMGGHAAGEVASLAAVETLRAAFAEQPHTIDGLIEAVRLANRAVWDRAAEDDRLRGMGTTLTVVALVQDEGEDHLAVANVGDSRAYLLRDGELGMLTDDHSVAEQLVREGRLTPDEAAVHPQRHVLTRVLGMAPEIDVDCYPILPYKGDRFLLCSDGLINEVSDSQIASVLRRLADPKEVVNELVAMARANGGHDNITVVVVDVVDDDERAETASAALSRERPRSPTTARRSPPDADDGPASAPAAPESVPTEPPGGAPGDHRRPRARRRGVTIRVALFLAVLVAVLAVAAAAVGYYARGSYFVGVDQGRVMIFKGRPGGLLWFDPTIRERTSLAAANVPATRVDDVRAGKVEPSLAAARRYVQNLVAEHDQLTGSTTTTTAVTNPFSPGATTTVATGTTGKP